MLLCFFSFTRCYRLVSIKLHTSKVRIYANINPGIYPWRYPKHLFNTIFNKSPYNASNVVTAAGVMFLCNNSETGVKLLMGQEIDRSQKEGLYTYCGGGRASAGLDNNYMDTATREVYEETYGCINKKVLSQV